MFGDAYQHSRTELLAIVEGEHEVGPAFPSEDPMRACLTLLISAEFEQRSENAPGLA